MYYSGNNTCESVQAINREFAQKFKPRNLNIPRTLVAKYKGLIGIGPVFLRAHVEYFQLTIQLICDFRSTKHAWLDKLIYKYR